MLNTYIYSLDCPFTGDVKYIGKACDVDQRYLGHIKEAKFKKKNTYKNNWIRSVLKYNSMPVLNIIDNVPFNEWHFWERHYISLYKSFGFKLTNLTDGGDGGLMSLEVRVRMSNIRKGTKLSDDTKRKIGLKALGKCYAKGNMNRRKELTCFDVITGVINYYPSSYHAALELKVLPSTIRNNVCGLSSIVSKRYKFFL